MSSSPSVTFDNLADVLKDDKVVQVAGEYYHFLRRRIRLS